MNNLLFGGSSTFDKIFMTLPYSDECNEKCTSNLFIVEPSKSQRGFTHVQDGSVIASGSQPNVKGMELKPATTCNALL